MSDVVRQPGFVVKGDVITPRVDKTVKMISSLDTNDNLITNTGTNTSVLIEEKILQVGNTSEVAVYTAAGANSSLIVIDKPNAASDASLILNSAGDGKWEIGMAGDENLYWKKITGTEAGGYTFASVLYMDYTNLRVGIGTELPSSKLEIAEDSDAARVEMRITNKSTSGVDGSALVLSAETSGDAWYIGTDAGLNGGKNFFINDGTFGEGIFIADGGNVGIQQASASTALDVNGTVTATAFAGDLTGDVTGTASGNLALTGGTMSGNITLGENTSIALDPAGSADEKWSGITVAGTAGATLAVGDLIYLDVTATEWLLADASAAGTAGSVVLGICVAASTNGNATTILLNGTVRSAAFPASIALGAPVYASETAGDLTATAPTTTDAVVRVLGWAVSAEPNTLYFNPSSDYITVV